MSTSNNGKTPTSGERYASGDWQGYWSTAISYVQPQYITVRGYRQEELFNLTYTELLYLTVRGELPQPEQTRVLEAVLVSMPDHYFVASHTPAARFTASANPVSSIPAIAAAILTMGGGTVSPQDSAMLIQRGLDRMAETGRPMTAVAEELVDEYESAGRRLPGLGHPTHKLDDARSNGIRAALVREGMFRERSRFYEELQAAYQRKKGRFLVINVDGMIACALSELGFDPLEMAGIGAICVLPGIIAHVVEEIRTTRGLRLIPEALGAAYVGPAERHMPPEFADRLGQAKEEEKR